ncbi:MAG: hypothetical protein N2167_07495 [Flavobacteriales bacterium]|nr:hypothetical protein [Flavobacteriales bacterium]
MKLLQQIIGLTTLVILLNGCSAFTKFYINLEEDITVSPGLGINIPFTSSTPPFPTQSAVAFQNNNTNADLLESCKLDQLRAEIISPDNYDFSFLNSAEIFISTATLPEVKVAYINNIPEDVGSIITFQTTNAELVEYIKNDQMIIRISTIQDKTTLQEVRARLYSRFFVDAKILGM